MKKTLLGALLSLLLLPAISPPTHAASLLFGQKQSYSAVVRADGSVITFGKIYLDNQTDAPLTKTSFELPDGITISDLDVYQITLPETCKNNTSEESSTDRYSYRYQPSCNEIKQGAFGGDNYFYYDGGTAQLVYKQIQPKQTEGIYELALPESIAPREQGAYLVAYKTGDYTSGSLGFYHLSFKTLKVDQSVNEVTVGIDLASDLYSRSGRSAIDESRNMLDITSGAVSAGNQSIKSSNLDRLQSSIGSGSVITKTGKSLSPGESFEVSGDIADANWKLYWKELVFGAAVVVLIVLLTIFLLKKAQSSDIPKAKTVKKGKK